MGSVAVVDKKWKRKKMLINKVFIGKIDRIHKKDLFMFDLNTRIIAMQEDSYNITDDKTGQYFWFNTTNMFHKEVFNMLRSNRILRNMKQNAVDVTCSENQILFKLTKQLQVERLNEKKRPYSLKHFAAAKLTTILGRYDINTLGSIFIQVRQNNLPIRVGRFNDRILLNFEDIIKKYIYKKINRTLVNDRYFENVRIRPSPGCITCMRITQETDRFDTICWCDICYILRRGMEYSKAIEISSHYTKCDC